MTTCPLPELAEEFRKVAKKAGDDNDILKCLLFGVIATRFERADNEILELTRTLGDCDAQSRRRLKYIEELETQIVK